MKMKFIVIVGGVLLVALLMVQHSQLQSLQLKLDESKRLAESRSTTIQTMKQKNAEVALISEVKTKELNDAKAKIELLERDIAAGNKRLFINASCPAVSSKSSTASVDDERPAKLTANAERAYFRLRNQLELVTRQLTGLQEYVKALPAECVAQPLVAAR